MSSNLELEKGYEVKNDKILYYEAGGIGNIESHHYKQQERINALVRGIHKIIVSNLTSMGAGNSWFFSIKLFYFF